MTTHSDDNAENEEREPDDDLLEKLYQFDQHIQEGLQGDPRLDSGVPDSARGSDLDFIRMSGLTAPPPADARDEMPPLAAESELDATKPVSFFEKGVADVDAAMAPGLEEEHEAPTRESVPVAESRAAMAHLRDMIAELTKDEEVLRPLEELTPETAKTAEPELPGVPIAAEDEVAPEPPEAQPPSRVLPETEPEPAAEPEPAPAFEVEAATEPEPAPEPAIEAEAIVEPELAPEPEPASEPESVPTLEWKAAEPEPESETAPEPEPAMEAEAIGEPERAEGDVVIFTPEAFPSGQYVCAEDLAAPGEPQFEPEPASPWVQEERVERFAESASAAPVERRAKLERGEPAARAPEPSVAALPNGARIYAPPPEPSPRLTGMPSKAKDVESREPPDDGTEPQGATAIPSIAEAEEAMYLRDHGKKRRRSGHRKHARRRIFRMVVAAVVVCAIGAGLYKAYRWYDERIANPASLYSEAASLLAKGDVLQAADKFEAFASRNPDSPMRADAQFAAAFALQQRRSESRDESTAVYGRSLDLFKQFVDEHPTHPKAPRATVLMGRLHYELGQYREAIELLQDPELRLRDPLGAVPALRTLARSWAKLGQDESARSYYIQSVGHQDNHAPDVDYMELGSVYRNLTDQVSDPGARKKYAELAIAQWTHATQAPGIDPESKRELRSKIETLRQREALGEGAPVAESVAPMQEVDGSLAREAPEHTVLEDIPWEATVPAIDPNTHPASSAPASGDAAVDPGGEDAEMESATHAVRAGDTLSAIADQHGVTVEQLMEWNGLTGSTIFVGQELVLQDPGIPATELDAAANEGV